ncbi:MAG TPA: PEP-CTERM sorting domain-containing protein, partial [Thermoguttaceae bacterium]|nr:PEP-CTERM sorting domain-containing protein [Thermoguttaceae bacterium]
FNWTGGTLHVDTFGTAATPFNLSQQGGVLAPGQSIGSTSIYGNYTQAAPGILEIEIASPTSFDTVTVYGNAELHGQILVSLLGGYVPAVGQRFPILSTTGSLDISGLSVGNMQPVAIGWVLELAAGQGGGQVLLLQAVPEPTSGILGLLALAGLGLVLLGRSRNRCRA